MSWLRTPLRNWPCHLLMLPIFISNHHANTSCLLFFKIRAIDIDFNNSSWWWFLSCTTLSMVASLLRLPVILPWQFFSEQPFPSFTIMQASFSRYSYCSIYSRQSQRLSLISPAILRKSLWFQCLFWNLMAQLIDFL